MSEPARCVIRAVQEDDARQLFDWVNRPDSRAASFVTREAVEWEDHCRWLAQRLADPMSRLWIVESGGRAVGQIRLQTKGQNLELAIYVEAADRGQGVAADSLELALAEAGRVWPGAQVVARVRIDNERSRRFFESRGFHLLAATDDGWVFSRVI